MISGGLPTGTALAQGLFGSQPKKLAADRSIYRIRGTASVNGKAATLQTRVLPGDVVETGKDSEVIFAVGGHSMILRSEGRIEIEGRQDSGSSIISALRMLTGKLLSVSRRSRIRFRTGAATIGIRGTGWYAEADPEQTYFCTCYGTSDIASSADSQSRETVVSEYHDRPVYVLAEAPSGQAIRDAPFINHTDQELALIEALVGREPPFVFSGDDYVGPRRDY